jgi:hypothetical protein
MKLSTTMTGNFAEHRRRLDCLREALDAGLPLPEARRLAFWRWCADRNRETGRRVLVRVAESGLRPA